MTLHHSFIVLSMVVFIGSGYSGERVHNTRRSVRDAVSRYSYSTVRALEVHHWAIKPLTTMMVYWHRTKGCAKRVQSIPRALSTNSRSTGNNDLASGGERRKLTCRSLFERHGYGPSQMMRQKYHTRTCFCLSLHLSNPTRQRRHLHITHPLSTQTKSMPRSEQRNHT